MSAPEPRPIVRHRITRHRFPGVGRPYPMVVAVLVTLASVPMLAVVLAGSASLTTTADSRSTVAAEPPHDPVVIPGRGDAGSASPRPPAASPVPSPPTAASPPAPLPPAEDTITITPRSPREESARFGGSGSGSRSGSGSESGSGSGSGATPPPAEPPGAGPAPAPGDGREECAPVPGRRSPSDSDGDRSGGAPSGRSPEAPPRSAPSRPAPAPGPGGDDKVLTVVGELLGGVGRLLGYPAGHPGER
ncbi:hypothetical protein [Planosporangium mesophilum]|uniref:Uncharacterized protein n=1 Tax=Planosporangium mesophilum TaxID=689768 RepID=A0A8J3T974_9ACTN|nr:hypothetical protein [Planosporangium mesophilum]NJC82119.1 hypothetical protein [Planosporangium mesophilum]GII22163.1 hypothetical protein Pme01_17600 [Planosporangium mesophilum]